MCIMTWSTMTQTVLVKQGCDLKVKCPPAPNYKILDDKS